MKSSDVARPVTYSLGIFMLLGRSTLIVNALRLRDAWEVNGAHLVSVCEGVSGGRYQILRVFRERMGQFLGLFST